LNHAQEPRPSRRTGKGGSRDLDLNSWVRIGLASRGKAVFNNLFCHFNAENLRQAFRALDGSKARGVDGVAKHDYGLELDGNISDLLGRLHTGTYRPSAKRQVLIPKANGKTRPIAISTFEDKMVEWVLGKILESVYEPDFIKHSYGFRPRKSAHDAIETSFDALRKDERPYVVEIDLANFFGTVPHRKLMRLIYRRIRDPRLLGLIARFLRSQILDESGETSVQETGTPQGSVMSPILANIYLHYVLDQWFMENHVSKHAMIIRYADDAVFLFNKEDKAKAFVGALRDRLAAADLSLNEEKTKLIDLRKAEHQAFSFLGFTFYWARKRSRKQQVLSVKTAMPALRRKIQDYTAWIKHNRNRLKIRALWELTAAKLRGHYAYYGYVCNKSKLNHYYYTVIGSLFKWLNRRSQKRSYTWPAFMQKLASQPLPKPPTMSALRSIGWDPYAIAR
jgi:RNA-directed DNA polymerase